MGRHFTLEVKTSYLNKSADQNQTMDQVELHPGYMRALRAHIDAEKPARLVYEAYFEKKLPFGEAKNWVLEELKKLFLTEFKKIDDFEKLNGNDGSKGILDTLNACQSIQDFMQSLGAICKSAPKRIPGTLNFLVKYLVNIHQSKDSSYDSVIQKIGEAKAALIEDAEESTKLDAERDFYLDTIKFKASDLRATFSSMLNSKLVDHLIKYGNQNGFIRAGSNALRDMLAPTNLSNGDKNFSEDNPSIITEIIIDSSSQYRLITYERFWGYEKDAAIILKENIAAALCTVITISDPGEDEEVECHMSKAVLDVYDKDLETEIKSNWLPKIIDKILNGTILFSYEKQVAKEWLNQFLKEGTYANLDLPLAAAIFLAGAQKEVLDGWILSHQNDNYVKLTLDEIIWLLKNKVDYAERMLQNNNIYLRLLAEDKLELLTELNCVKQQKPMLSKQHQRLQTFLDAAKKPLKEKVKLFKKDEDKNFYFDAVFAMVKKGKLDSNNETNVKDVLSHPKFTKILTPEKLTKLALTNDKVARCLLVPWEYARGGFWQRRKFINTHACQNITNEQLKLIALAHPSLWRESCSVFGVRSWFKETRFGWWLYGKPYRYQLTSEDYIQLWANGSDELKDNIAALAKKDKKLKQILKATKVSEIREAISKTARRKLSDAAPPRVSPKLGEVPKEYSRSSEALNTNSIQQQRRVLKKESSNRAVSVPTSLRESLLRDSAANIINGIRSNDAEIEEVVLHFLSDEKVKQAIIKKNDILKFIVEYLTGKKNQHNLEQDADNAGEYLNNNSEARLEVSSSQHETVLALLLHSYDYTQLSSLSKAEKYLYSPSGWQASLAKWLHNTENSIELTDEELVTAIQQDNWFELRLLFRADLKLIKRAMRLKEIDWGQEIYDDLFNYLLDRFTQLQPNLPMMQWQKELVDTSNFFDHCNSDKINQILQSMTVEELFYAYMNGGFNTRVAISLKVSWVAKIYMIISPLKLKDFLKKEAFCHDRLAEILLEEYKTKPYIRAIVNENSELLAAVYTALEEYKVKENMWSDIRVAQRLLLAFDLEQIILVFNDSVFRPKAFIAMQDDFRIFVAILQKIDKNFIDQFEDELADFLSKVKFTPQLLEKLGDNGLNKLLGNSRLSSKVYASMQGVENVEMFGRFFEKINPNEVTQAEDKIANLLSNVSFTQHFLEKSDRLHKLLDSPKLKRKVYAAMRGTENIKWFEKFLQSQSESELVLLLTDPDFAKKLVKKMKNKALVDFLKNTKFVTQLFGTMTKNSDIRLFSRFLNKMHQSDLKQFEHKIVLLLCDINFARKVIEKIESRHLNKLLNNDKIGDAIYAAMSGTENVAWFEFFLQKVDLKKIAKSEHDLNEISKLNFTSNGLVQKILEEHASQSSLVLEAQASSIGISSSPENKNFFGPIKKPTIRKSHSFSGIIRSKEVAPPIDLNLEISTEASTSSSSSASGSTENSDTSDHSSDDEYHQNVLEGMTAVLHRVASSQSQQNYVPKSTTTIELGPINEATDRSLSSDTVTPEEIFTSVSGTSANLVK